MKAIEKVKEMTVFLNEEKRKFDARTLAKKIHADLDKFCETSTLFEFEGELFIDFFFS